MAKQQKLGNAIVTAAAASAAAKASADRASVKVAKLQAEERLSDRSYFKRRYLGNPWFLLLGAGALYFGAKAIINRPPDNNRNDESSEKSKDKNLDNIQVDTSNLNQDASAYKILADSQFNYLNSWNVLPDDKIFTDLEGLTADELKLVAKKFGTREPKIFGQNVNKASTIFEWYDAELKISDRLNFMKWIWLKSKLWSAPDEGWLKKQYEKWKEYTKAGVGDGDKGKIAYARFRKKYECTYVSNDPNLQGKKFYIDNSETGLNTRGIRMGKIMVIGNAGVIIRNGSGITYWIPGFKDVTTIPFSPSEMRVRGLAGITQSEDFNYSNLV